MGYIIKQLATLSGNSYAVIMADAVADIATLPAYTDGSVAYIKDDPDKLYIKLSGTWTLIAKTALPAGPHIDLDGVNPYALMLANALFARRSELVDSILTTRGDLLYRNATVPARLAKGTAGYVLSQGANDPAWVAPGGLAITDTGTYFGTDTINGALQELGPLLATERHPEYIRSAEPTAQNDQYEGMLLYNTTDHKLKVCTTPGESEWDTVTVATGCTTNGNVTITLNGVAVNVAVTAGQSAVQVAAAIRAAAFSGWTMLSATGDIIDFQKAAVGTCSAPTANGAATGVTFSAFVRTNEGVAAVWYTINHA